MEETTNEIEVNESLKSPPRRRRSTFFERRESIVPQTDTESVNPNRCTVDVEECPKSSQDLIRYHDQLQSEKEQWKKEVNDRRHKYHDLRQQYQMAVKTPGRSRMCYSALTDEDIEFIKGKTNISKLVEASKKLHESVKVTRALYKKANELDDVTLDYCEKKVNEITDYIVNNSTIEPME